MDSVEMCADKSAAIAWRELMSATGDVDSAVQDAWEHWRERESLNGRVRLAVGEDPA